MLAYHERLDSDPKWALEQGGKFFMGLSEVNAALQRITERLDSLGVPYALVGGMALFQHGYRRFTEDIDLLIRGEDLKRIHEELEGRGYLPKFAKSKNLRDTEAGVAIEFLITGEFPGDGKPKPVSFPEPESASIDIGGINCINLVSLVELKLASGMTSTDRLRDLGDVQELIRVLGLDERFAEQLNPYVKEKFIELWSGERKPRRYMKVWPKNLGEANASPELDAMLAEGVSLEPIDGDGDYSWLATTDAAVAAKFDMHDEQEFMS